MLLDKILNKFSYLANLLFLKKIWNNMFNLQLSLDKKVEMIVFHLSQCLFTIYSIIILEASVFYKYI